MRVLIIAESSRVFWSGLRKSRKSLIFLAIKQLNYRMTFL
jgi:hypothetical protein